MNRDCNGDFFSVDGARYYRCLRDGAVILPATDAVTCANCQRVIAHAEDHGRLESVTERFVVFPNGWKVPLPQAP